MSNAVHALATLIKARPSVTMAKYAAGDLHAVTRYVDDVVRTMKDVPKSGVSDFWRAPITSITDDAVRASTLLHTPNTAVMGTAPRMNELAQSQVNTLVDRMLTTIDDTLTAANRVLA